MSIKILDISDNKKEHKFNIKFDVCGNIYFENKENIYQLNINNKNNIVGEKGDYNIIENPNFTCKGLLSENELNELENTNNKNNDIYVYSDENEDLYENSEEYFKFSDFVSFEINTRKNGDVNALYDTVINKNSQLMYRTKLENGVNIFTLYINIDLNDSVICEIKPTGMKSISVIPFISNNNIVFIKNI